MSYKRYRSTIQGGHQPMYHVICVEDDVVADSYTYQVQGNMQEHWPHTWIGWPAEKALGMARFRLMDEYPDKATYLVAMEKMEAEL